MLLSDELIEIGRTANPNNNQSQGEAATRMHFTILRVYGAELYSMKQLYNITKLACETLNTEGFKYYGVDIFFTD